jgi:outer membrane protein assembly factor BamB
MPRPIAVLCLFLLSPTLFAQAEQAKGSWPHLRGPRYDGVSRETGLVNAWPEGGPPVLWQRELGQGFSGFVVAAGRVYTQYQSSVGQYVLCLDAVSGDEAWRTRVGWPWQPAGAYPGPYATPTYHDGHVYYATPAGVVGCLDAVTGRTRWDVDLRKKFKGEGTGFGYAATPLVEDGKVILPVGGKGASVVALGAGDGSVTWAAGDDPASYCPAYPITLGGRRVVVALMQNSLAGHDVTTGKLLFREGLSKGYDEHSAWPLYSEPHLLTASPFFKGARLYRLDQAKETAIPTVWSNQNLSNDVSSSVLFDGHVYGFDLRQLQTSPHRTSRGSFKCLDFATGDVRWETKQVGQAGVVVADGKLILHDDGGWLILARATPDAYQELARTRVFDGKRCWTPPTLCDRRLYVRDPSRMVCLYLGPPESLDPSQRLGVEAKRGLELDLRWLLGREPEFPHDAPRVEDVALWFGWCVGGVFGVAAVAGGLVLVVAWKVGAARPGLWASLVFAIVAFALGLAGTRLYGELADAFVLTWPASLYVSFRVTLAVITWAEVRPPRRGRRMAARGMMLLLLLLCYGYYQLCLAAGYVVAWGFLAGLLPAAPVAILASYSRRRWLSVPAEVVGFAVYFWAGGLLPGWKDQLLG